MPNWLVKLTTPVLHSTEWYYSGEATEQAAIQAVRAKNGRTNDSIEVVKSLTTDETRALRVDPKQIRELI